MSAQEYGMDALDVSATVDGVELSPVVLGVEGTGASEVVTYTDQCGHEEADSNAQGNAQHSIEGLFDQDTLQYLYELYQSGENVTVTLPADIDTVGVFITDMTWKQGTDTHLTITSRYGIEIPVWHTQVQLKQSGVIEESG